MDAAYAPLINTIEPSISVAANDEPWRTISSTQTLFWHVAAAERCQGALSTLSRPVPSFFILDTPALNGLERLRTFREWKDNWDAEGGKAPEAEVVDFASKVFALLAIHRTPSVGLSAEGFPMFLYGAPSKGEVVVTGVNTIDYFFVDDEGLEGEGVALEEGLLPTDLVARLQAA